VQSEQGAPGGGQPSRTGGRLCGELVSASHQLIDRVEIALDVFGEYPEQNLIHIRTLLPSTSIEHQFE
jgi:hypothetical protein